MTKTTKKKLSRDKKQTVSKSTPLRLSKLVKGCAGCAAKLSPLLLRKALSNLPRDKHPDLLVGAETMDDAGVFRISENLAVINTTDFFTPVVDHPVEFGRIAATNAMSDIYSMGGEVLTVLNLVSFPRELPLSILNQILKGSSEKVIEAGGLTVGGHSIATETLIFGLAVTGIIDPKHLVTNDKALPGHKLILTKPLGTGILMTAVKQDRIKRKEAEHAVSIMTQLNRGAAEVMRKHGVHAGTDVTGFGLLGHAMQMAHASKVTFELLVSKIPILEGTTKLAKQGAIPGALRTNEKYVKNHLRLVGRKDNLLHPLLVDPQTSGGILMSVAPEKVAMVLEELIAKGFKETTVIGEVKKSDSKYLILHY